MKRGMTIEYLKCRKDLNFEVDFGVNDVIGTIVTEWNVILFGQWLVFIHNIFFCLNTHPMSLTYRFSDTFLDDVKYILTGNNTYNHSNL